MPVMKQQDFLKEEGILSPKKEAEFKAAFENPKVVKAVLKSI